MANELRDAILQTSKKIGINPLDLATAMSYETGGTYDPWQKGPTTQWGEHRGLIQWGEPQRQKYGVAQDTPVAAQVDAAGRYLVDAGVKPGMGLLDVYSAINAGRVGRYGASDANNGGAPGNAADKVNNQMSGHKQNAMKLLGEMGGEQYAANPRAQPSAPVIGSMAPQIAGPSSGVPAFVQELAAGGGREPQDDSPSSYLSKIFGAMGSQQQTQDAPPPPPNFQQSPQQANALLSLVQALKGRVI